MAIEMVMWTNNVRVATVAFVVVLRVAIDDHPTYIISALCSVNIVYEWEGVSVYSCAHRLLAFCHRHGDPLDALTQPSSQSSITTDDWEYLRVRRHRWFSNTLLLFFYNFYLFREWSPAIRWSFPGRGPLARVTLPSTGSLLNNCCCNYFTIQMDCIEGYNWTELYGGGVSIALVAEKRRISGRSFF